MNIGDNGNGECSNVFMRHCLFNNTQRNDTWKHRERNAGLKSTRDPVNETVAAVTYSCRKHQKRELHDNRIEPRLIERNETFVLIAPLARISRSHRCCLFLAMR